MKIIIIGGVAGGATTAARIRRVDETAEIVLLEKGKYISYANCGLPYYIGGVIEERDKLFVQTPEAFSTRFRVDVRTENEAIFIDRKRKTVTIRQSSEDTYEENYDKLVISTGASPVRPPLPGIDLSGIFTLRNVTDTDRIKEYIKSHAPRKAVVVGAGFIGLEMAENLHAQGAKVSIVEMGNQVMAPIDFSMASLVHQHLMDKGVNLYLEQAVASFTLNTDTSAHRQRNTIPKSRICLKLVSMFFNDLNSIVQIVMNDYCYLVLPGCARWGHCPKPGRQRRRYRRRNRHRRDARTCGRSCSKCIIQFYKPEFCT